MRDIKELNRKEVKKIISTLEEIYSTELKIFYENNYHFFINKRTNKIYLSNFSKRQIENIGFSKEKINNLGLYFATIHSEGRIRLSIEGSRFIIPKSNFVIIDESIISSFLAGENLFIDEVVEFNHNGSTEFLIMRFNNISIGVVSKKKNILINYVPKSRRIKFNRLF